jgi:iron complex transport system ATP-binding protein
MTSLSATSVSFSAGAKTIVRDVSLETGAGEMTAIVGPNGAGKSTLMEMLAGFLRATSGEVRVGGEPVDRIAVDQLARLRAYLMPDLMRTIRFTVREVVDMGRHPWTSRGDRDPGPTDWALEAMDLKDLASHVFATLSTGEARRTQIARVLAQSVKIMLLDEPTSGLDIAHSELVLDALQRSARTGAAVVCVIHDLNAAAQVVDRMILLAHGAVVADGPPEDVLTEELLTNVYEHPIRVRRHPFREGLLVLPDAGAEL